MEIFDVYRWSVRQLQLTVLAGGRAVAADGGGEYRGEECPHGRSTSAAAVLREIQQRPLARTRMGADCWRRQRSQRRRSRLGWCLVVHFRAPAPFCRRFRCLGMRIDVCLMLYCVLLSVLAVRAVFLLVLAVRLAGWRSWWRARRSGAI